MWGDLSLNLVSEFIGVAVELILIYFLINTILAKRENERWKPTRKLILNKMLSSYGSLFAAARHAMKLDAPNSTFENRILFLQQAQQYRNKLQNFVDLNSPALDSNLMPIISTYLDTSEKLFHKLAYFIGIYDPEKNNFDFVGEPPFDEIEKIYGLIDRVRENYFELLDEGNKEPALKDMIGTIKQIWLELEKSTDRLHFNPGNYEYNGERTPYVYNYQTLTKLNENITDGQKVKVFTDIN